MEVEKNIKNICSKHFQRIMDNLGNTLGQEGIDLLDRKQKEKDKKELMDKQQLKLKLN